MPDIIKVTDLTELTTPADGDFVPIVDISEALDVDKNKKISVLNLLLSKITKPSLPSFTSMLYYTTSGVTATRQISQTVQIQMVAEIAEVNLDVVYFFVPSTMTNMNLVRATAMVLTAGTTNATVIQVRNMTRYSSNDALSTAISIASGATAATPGTVNTSYDDVLTDDKIRITVNSQSTTKPKGLFVVLEYRLP